MKALKPSPDPVIRKALSRAYWQTAAQIATQTGLERSLVSARLRMMYANDELDRQPSPESFQYRLTVRKHDHQEDAAA